MRVRWKHSSCSLKSDPTRKRFVRPQEFVERERDREGKSRSLRESSGRFLCRRCIFDRFLFFFIQGVTGASQLRYVSYFGAVLNAKKKPIPRYIFLSLFSSSPLSFLFLSLSFSPNSHLIRRLRLMRVILASVPNFLKGKRGMFDGCRPLLLIWNGSLSLSPLFSREVSFSLFLLRK